MTDFLQQACAAARRRVAEARTATALEALAVEAGRRDAPPRLSDALRMPGTSVIAEVKRASPSRGPIAAIADPGRLAASYAAGGAAAISVLTEPHWFSGSLDDLRDVASAVAVPALRKDFVVDPYQIWEARAAGASAVLLIVAALPPPELKGLLAVTVEAGLEALIEVHDPAEAALASEVLEAAGVEHGVIGVNARDLATLAVDPQRFEQVREALPSGALAVAESGVSGPEDVRRLASLGADAVLVGEHLARADDPAAAVAALVGAGRP